MAKQRAANGTKQLDSEGFSKVIDLIALEGLSLIESCTRVGVTTRAFYEYINLQAGSLQRWKKEVKPKTEDELKEKSTKEANLRRNEYARACEARADIYFDQILEIADTPLKATTKETTTKMYKGKPVNEVVVKEGDAIDHRRLQIDARKWMLGKMNPKKYGNQVQINGGIDDKGEAKPILLRVETNKMSDDQFDEATKI